MTSIAELRKKSAQNLDRLKEKTKEDNNQRNDNPNIWQLKRGKDGTAFAIIRFLPISKVDEQKDPDKAMPWVKMWSYSFQNKELNRWYIEKSLTSIGKPDPVYEYNRKLYDQNTDEAKKKAGQQKRKLDYFSNVYIVHDPANPENNGTVKIFKYGQKIHDKILNLMSPPEEFMEEKCDPFDLFNGKDFRLKVRTVDDWPNYDLSDWSDRKPISDANGKPLSDEKIIEIYESEHSLLDLLDPANYKPYDVLKKRLDWVLGLGEETSEAVERVSPPKKSEEPKQVKSEAAPAKRAVEEKKAESVDDDLDLDIDLDDIINSLDDE